MKGCKHDHGIQPNPEKGGNSQHKETLYIGIRIKTTENTESTET
jgi:hypothetical protein